MVPRHTLLAADPAILTACMYSYRIKIGLVDHASHTFRIVRDFLLVARNKYHCTNMYTPLVCITSSMPGVNSKKRTKCERIANPDSIQTRGMTVGMILFLHVHGPKEKI